MWEVRELVGDGAGELCWGMGKMEQLWLRVRPSWGSLLGEGEEAAEASPLIHPYGIK